MMDACRYSISRRGGLERCDGLRTRELLNSRFFYTGFVPCFGRVSEHVLPLDDVNTVIVKGIYHVTRGRPRGRPTTYGSTASFTKHYYQPISETAINRSSPAKASGAGTSRGLRIPQPPH